MPGCEEIQDDIDADPTAAANFKDRASGNGAAHIEESFGLKMALHRSPKGVVHQCVFERVENHGLDLDSVPGGITFVFTGSGTSYRTSLFGSACPRRLTAIYIYQLFA